MYVSMTETITSRAKTQRSPGGKHRLGLAFLALLAACREEILVPAAGRGAEDRRRKTEIGTRSMTTGYWLPATASQARLRRERVGWALPTVLSRHTFLPALSRFCVGNLGAPYPIRSRNK
jgi:hypothetical protein